MQFWARRRLVLWSLVVPVGLIVLGWWFEHYLRLARAGSVPSSGSMPATGTYSGGLGVVVLGSLAYLVYLVVVVAVWFREHRAQHPRLWARWVQLRDGPRPAPAARRRR